MLMAHVSSHRCSIRLDTVSDIPERRSRLPARVPLWLAEDGVIAGNNAHKSNDNEKSYIATKAVWCPTDGNCRSDPNHDPMVIA